MVMGKKRILLIEDDSSLLFALRYLLEDMGYEIVTAQDLIQAHAAVEGGPYAAAIVDYYIGSVPSADLIAELQRRHPGMPLVCSSAAFAEEIESHGAQPDAFLYKPYG